MRSSKSLFSIIMNKHCLKNLNQQLMPVHKVNKSLTNESKKKSKRRNNNQSLAFARSSIIFILMFSKMFFKRNMRTSTEYNKLTIFTKFSFTFQILAACVTQSSGITKPLCFQKSSAQEIEPDRTA